MAQKLKVAIYSFTLLLLISATSFAVCQFDGNTPEGGNIVSCPPPVQPGVLSSTSMPATSALADEVIILPGGGVNVAIIFTAVNTGAGDDFVTIQGEIVSADSTAIVTLQGDDTVILDGGFVSGGGSGSGIFTGDDNDTIIVNSGTATATGSGDSISAGRDNDNITIHDGLFPEDIDSGRDDDVVILNGGVFERLISAGLGNDIVTINGGEYGPASSIILGSGNDDLTFNADAEFSRIQCDDGFDTIVFAMTVPANQLLDLTGQVLQSNPEDDSIIINNIEYNWSECERLIPDFKAGPNVISTVPTLSEWGLIAMAGVLALISLMVIRKRQQLSV